MLTAIKKWFRGPQPVEVDAHIERLRNETPLPVFWLFGKTQSGKTSIIKYLTGADEAEIGRGFKPCTRYSREYRFPSFEIPLLDFLDTRGLEEPGYDAKEDLDRFNSQAHLMIVTVRVLDHAVEHTVKELRTIRASQPSRPVILALTCLHEAYPQQQHPNNYPFHAKSKMPPALDDGVPNDLARSIAEQCTSFQGLYDYVVPLDLTPAQEGFTEPSYGGARLKEVLVEALPAAYRQTLLTLEATTNTLRNYYEKLALPYILGFSGLAASAGAIPIPWVDLLLLPGIQTRMIYRLAMIYGQPLSGPRFLEFAGSLGLGMLVRQGIRELAKFIPGFGSVAGAALAASTTFALGKAFCFYYGAVQKGHVPHADELKRYYREQLVQAEKLWSQPKAGESK